VPVVACFCLRCQRPRICHPGRAMQAALRERYALLPYLYTLFRRANETGEPIMRPMFYEFPADTDLFDVDHQFMFGDAVLAAPVLEQGANHVDVHIPVGEVFYTPSGDKIVRPQSGVYKHPVTMDTIAGCVAILSCSTACLQLINQLCSASTLITRYFVCSTECCTQQIITHIQILPGWIHCTQETEAATIHHRTEEGSFHSRGGLGRERGSQGQSISR
jgi:hypothetical protein